MGTISWLRTFFFKSSVFAYLFQYNRVTSQWQIEDFLSSILEIWILVKSYSFFLLNFLAIGCKSNFNYSASFAENNLWDIDLICVFYHFDSHDLEAATGRMPNFFHTVLLYQYTLFVLNFPNEVILNFYWDFDLSS